METGINLEVCMMNMEKYFIGIYFFNSFRGTWNFGKRHGRGMEYNENGIVEYDGEWVDDKWSGFGTQYDENGDILRRGFWKDGKL